MIIAIKDPAIFIGLSLNDAQSQIAGYGYSCRILRVDNSYFVPRGKDYDPLRVNLKIQKNRVYDAYIG